MATLMIPGRLEETIGSLAALSGVEVKSETVPGPLANIFKSELIFPSSFKIGGRSYNSLEVSTRLGFYNEDNDTVVFAGKDDKLTHSDKLTRFSIYHTYKDKAIVYHEGVVAALIGGYYFQKQKKSLAEKLLRK